VQRLCTKFDVKSIISIDDIFEKIMGDDYEPCVEFLAYIFDTFSISSFPECMKDVEKVVKKMCYLDDYTLVEFFGERGLIPNKLYKCDFFTTYTKNQLGDGMY